MKFIVSEEVFDKLENVCFGVVIAKGINNKNENLQISKLLDKNIKLIEEKFGDKKVKESDEIIYYREAFKKLNINPNKFMSSIEAMVTRVSKKKGLPKINSIVDIGNAISLKYLIPLGAHDIDSADEDICVRFSKQGDKFIPFGEKEGELLDQGELIYSVGNRVKTRRWIWRQSEEGKITKESKNIFFPIDGFKDKNHTSVINARDELGKLLKDIFNCEVTLGFIDKYNREIQI
ncbi:DNA/RNA-binding domain of Phe-tRNA-synthetase-like protein [Clostridium tetanomorphum]|uniref:B3/B4 tRNA-binding domain-containing protein n=1 Tax=Clostridium tetanomorphum TaxID=1553 RepID=A0A923E7D1_CLOTT|nr:phenylalanine--tRNA ligase beta subunit-related protein [Clostridium tetanomorphum]KAJ52372.1 B3/4 domain-containing protein [Clostridium tetanomorphum DSM 665]MBC2397892.1 hypothetical protein [Clostridium tetanomorphum]MBP1864792.1 DNA/RNA-binding domain of Phe-tRNA-synthetase-like protein [Clostridium tetanomorphum]NRS83968.1 DNA/RNA-binding domain of Phe-tRNA-synthetase-like protein [Clostridium tetanomorphum]NRZ97187.1 DNA/RNA-binding domain of Phe-tRNA-synthetase-like protein [Clostri